jgi:hypothetical protein
MAVIGINYVEPNPETYESVRISYGGLKKEKIFDSGDFVRDWYNLNKWIVDESEGELKNEHFSNSSSVNHFIMDGAPYVSRYLRFIENQPYLSSEYDWMDEGTELFIPEGKKWSWDELKKYANESGTTKETSREL